MTLNVELLRKVKQHILAHPELLDMETWACGTQACIAGWTLLLTGNADRQELCDAFGKPDPGRRAAELLGVSEDDADHLFLLDSWPEEMQEEYLEGGKDIRAEVTASMIETFIAEHTT